MLLSCIVKGIDLGIKTEVETALDILDSIERNQFAVGLIV